MLTHTNLIMSRSLHISQTTMKFSTTTMATPTDWRYSEERMSVRTQGLKILLKKFGSELGSDGTPKYSCQSIYECIHDWVSQGNLTTSGIVKYYLAYYADS